MRSTVYVCIACDKRSRDLYGQRPVNYGWDASCVMSAVECYEDALVIENDRAIRVEEGGVLNRSTEEKEEKS